MQEKKSTKVNFPERLSELMEISGLKQKEIAAKTGLTSTALIHYKSGRSLPGSPELYRLSKFLAAQWSGF